MLDYLTNDDDEMFYSGLFPFTPGKYYVADATGFIIGEYDTFVEAKKDCAPDDVILSAYNSLGSHLPLKTVKKCDKIIVDFKKKELTIGDEDVTIDKVQYEKDTVYDLDDDDLESWYNLLKDARASADSVEVVGEPPIKGRDITNEMSDL